MFEIEVISEWICVIYQQSNDGESEKVSSLEFINLLTFKILTFIEMIEYLFRLLTTSISAIK